jgi:hypothetical protein
VVANFFQATIRNNITVFDIAVRQKHKGIQAVVSLINQSTLFLKAAVTFWFRFSRLHQY